MKLNKRTAYIALTFSIIFEQVGTGLLGAADGFTQLKPTILLILAYIVSYYLFSKALELINLSVSYATWTAAGTVCAAVVGYLAYHDVISVIGWVASIIMGTGIVILNVFGSVPEDTETEGGNH